MKTITISDGSNGCNNSGHRKGHRRQESMYTMTGLYSETGDDSSIDIPPDSDNVEINPRASNAVVVPNNYVPDTMIKCHSRQPSASIIDQRDKSHRDNVEYSMDCGILGCRPRACQKFAQIKIFVLLLSMLVTLQQALSSGYINSVITTIEKRFEIPSSYSGLIASSYEIGNVITVIFVSYLGSRRHIPVWIGIGAIIMGIGSLIFMVPHFTGEANPGISLANDTSDNICRGVPVRDIDLGLGRLSNGLSHNNLREDNCIQVKSSTFGPVLLFVIAQMLLGAGGSPLFTLGTTYVDDHVRTESASIYIGFMYSMAAFGPVLGFLLGAYLLSFHMDSFSGKPISITPGDRRWVGMWWGGFLLGGLLLILVAIPFFSFPKVLTREKKKLRSIEQNLKPMVSNNSNSLQRQQQQTQDKQAGLKNATTQVGTSTANSTASPVDTGYGKDIKDLPLSMWRLVSNPIYIVTCLGACMELMIVSGFIVFLPKYLETQFSLGKSQASVFTGAIAVPGACIGIFLGGCFLKRFELKPKGAVQFVLVSNLICLACYGFLFFLGCDNLKMAGTTIPYYNSTLSGEPFQVNLTAACNFGCECHMSEVEPVCGNNGLTYFSPCHAGCTAFSSSSNYTNCACVQSNQPATTVYKGVGGSLAQASVASQDFAEVTVVPVASAGPCMSPCRTIYPFLILLFFMTFIVASTQMPLLMIVLRSVSEEERSFALGMQFVIFRLFGYIPAPILFGNLIDSTCLLWKSTCGEKGGRCLIYDIETFRYKYVGLGATIKLVALAIFTVDWWLVRRRKQLEYPSSSSSTNMGGSIISLDKLFAEKGVIDGQAAGYTNDLVMDDCMGDSNFDVNSKKVLIASRHHRNDSKGIQLELKYDNYNDKTENLKRRKHIRSNSCDVKIGRSNSRDYEKDGEYRIRRVQNNNAHTHSRNNSRDLDSDFRQRLTHSRTNSRDANIKFILNFIKPDHSSRSHLSSSTAMSPGTENSGLPPSIASNVPASKNVKKHSRNHSYDQIYNMPNNIQIDQELHNKLFKNRNKSSAIIDNDLNLVKNNNSIASNINKNNSNNNNNNNSNINNVNKEFLDNSNKFTNKSSDGAMASTSTALASGSDVIGVISSHSRNNSKDLNKASFLASLVDDAANQILRHRRTNSKDLNRLANINSPSTSTALIENNNCNNSNNNVNTNNKQQNQHLRNLSQSKNQIPHDAQDAAQVLLLRQNNNNNNNNCNLETSDSNENDFMENNE